MSAGTEPVATELATHGTHALVRNDAMGELFDRDSGNPMCSTTMYVGTATGDDERDVGRWRGWLRRIRAW